ncbi:MULTISPECIES: GntR family transcriptional regulator [Auritidibacter]|uniref:GntR family transcriptional regulator n=1 Tax=Auritidibacter TaxID=1160973 RepID=UPI000D7297DB|nr:MULTISPECIES: GntR family transcriptional regulator [Auritidibacter]PXA73866.1 GntR family transcriptional regulator [Auritidibacter sp. NML120779]AXR74666.1 GntR family transcriptional regulator [Auritidibacter sp. NML130574]NIH71055.1 DNA-binding GntR family transcriptional regulator [Auritidibacter ignavus]RMX23001.1 GntR family transcriptional regulator [Auritidibacter ignavus]WGH81203.1 GntR family transcriptional regulator [Auritidibacter ignavus]
MEEKILQLILDGEIRPGEWLRETDLATRLGVSRTPVRNAIAKLASTGVVVFHPNRGAQVRHYTVDDVVEIYESRALVESFVTGLVAEVIDPPRLEQLRELSDQMRVAEDGERARLNGLFHRAILAVRADHPLVGAAQNLVIPLLLHQVMASYGPAAIERSMCQHEEIIDALEHRDRAWAESAMRTHILFGLNQYRQHAS